MQTFMNTTAMIQELRLRREQRLPRPRIRFDSLPENTRYRDDGCDISATCLDCPLPRCRYEEPGGLRGVLNHHRDEKMLQMRLTGMSVEDLAVQFGVSRRTVFRIIGSSRKAGAERQDPAPRAPVAIRARIERKEAQCA
jgi:hypothetical protein